ncbi:MAG: MBOAT family protein, partial [Bacteroidia bacterium]|nr:MBOAT family protein [Bacteroidia bacterium]
MMLLVSSLYFYMCWKAEYVFLMLYTILVDYTAGWQMGKIPDRKKRRPWLAFSLINNLGILFAFKYLNFFNETARSVFQAFNLFYDVPAFHLILPVGISFYTFQSLTYSLDIYYDTIKPEKNYFRLALFVSYFPQLVAGPIQDAKHLLPELYKETSFEYERAVLGLRQILWGLFKKMVVADRMALVVNQIYNHPQEQSFLMFVIATYFFALQIYCDFSGYTDIAIGSARILGHHITENFRRPYLSLSISEFWRRWHITLGAWFRNYLYIPLGGNRGGEWLKHRNLMIVFLVSGLWHGANWTFVIWGFLHGLYMIIEDITGITQKKIFANATLQTWVFRLITFHLVLFAWVFFRANSLSDVLTFWGKLGDFRFFYPVMTDFAYAVVIFICFWGIE